MGDRSESGGTVRKKKLIKLHEYNHVITKYKQKIIFTLIVAQIMGQKQIFKM